MIKFEAETIRLDGKNLIEASAGTGKTYSVSLLALRLILEKGINADKILMVTFAEAAAAEMAERMRLFVKMAYDAALGNKCPNEQIKNIVKKSTDSIAKLRKAYMLLDEINVYTIHGFCNKMLRELAFETNADFDFDIIADDKSIFQEVFDHYWRTELILEENINYVENSNMIYQLLFDKEKKYVTKPEYLENQAFYDSLNTIIYNKITAYKRENNFLTYDDLIIHLHKASAEPLRAEILKNILSEKFDAVFIDECQDTDKNQFDIFFNLFPEKIHYYVGDPKQCIYKFRGADLDNYLLVKRDNKIEKYNMDTNYRSSPEIVEAVNNFYLEQDNPFQRADIDYIKVNANKESVFIEDENKNKLVPFSIFYKKPSKEEYLDEYIINRIIFYLTKCYFQDGTKIKPSDIAVLFRTNSKISHIRKLLIEIGIPAIEIKSNSIFASKEASLMVNALKLLLEPNRDYMIQFLTSEFIGYNPVEVAYIDISEEIQKIKEIKAGIDKNGIYFSLSKLIAYYHNETKIKEKYGMSYNRMKSNMLQLLDLMHSKIEKEKISFEQLLNFITREKRNSEYDIKNEIDSSESHYEQQLESDEKSVKLMTIHKSKGLEFPIVIFPVYSTIFNDEETHRVYYVALTRAKYKSDILCFENGNKSHKFFYQILQNLMKKPKTAQNFNNFTIADNFNTKNLSNLSIENLTLSEAPSAKIIDKSWKISSYSALATHTDYIPQHDENELTDAHDKFVFDKMPRGKSAGIFLHSLFENSDFTASDFTDYVNAVKSHYLIKKGPDCNTKNYILLIENVLEANYGGFNLKNIKRNNRLDELEYHLRIKDRTKIKAISKFLVPEADMGEAEISGMLKGFIDLIFEQDGKYYILDWKSNYLGNTQHAYDRENMEIAIKANSYDLQYHIYSIALCKFLQQRIPDFDFNKHFGGGFWVFLRGCRKGNTSGIYHFRPDFDLWTKLADYFSS